MMEDESKTQTTSDQSENTDQGTVDTNAAPRTDDTPRDGEGCESVTVVIIAHDERQGELMARSVKKNLTGVDADIHLVTSENLRNTLVETLADHMPHVMTERIILMTDGMVILNPVVMGDIACVKAVRNGDVIDFKTLLPVLMHKSALQQLLDSLKAEEKLYADIANEYFRNCMPDGYQPTVLRPWREENWLMLVTSNAPSSDALRQWGKTQKFAYISPKSWTDNVVKFLEEKLGE